VHPKYKAGELTTQMQHLVRLSTLCTQQQKQIAKKKKKKAQPSCSVSNFAKLLIQNL
jgi:hypothetical protein